MNSIETNSDGMGRSAQARAIEMRIEVVAVPVADVDRAKRFYGDLGWRLDIDYVRSDAVRVVQFTPPGSACSIHLRNGPMNGAPGSVEDIYLVVSDIQAAHADLVARGVAVSDLFHRVGPRRDRFAGPAPDGRSYASYASFADPDGNRWLLQEVTTRLPGR